MDSVYESDYNTVYIDVYERHPFTGTTLLCRATVRDVHQMLSQHSPARVMVLLHTADVKVSTIVTCHRVSKLLD